MKHPPPPVTHFLLPKITLFRGVHFRPALALEGLRKVDRVLHGAVDAPLGRTVWVGADLFDDRLWALLAAPWAGIGDKEELLGGEGLESWKLEVLESRIGLCMLVRRRNWG